MLFRNWLSVPLLLLIAVALMGSTACTSETAQADQLSSSTAATVVRVSPTPASSDAITISAVGDIMLGSTNPPERGLPPQDGALMLSEVGAILSAADLAFGNLEGPMLEGGTSSKCGPKSRKCYAFRVPTRYGKYLKEAGFDVMSLANNHASDFGLEGRQSTRRVLDQQGIAHAGADFEDIAYLNVKGRKVGVIAFATNAISYNVNDLEAARRIVARVASKSDIVIVSFHAGAEGLTAQHVPRGTEIFLSEKRGDLRAFSRTVVDAGADLILGHGPHVVRGLEVYKNRLIAYSLGNFAFYRFPFNGPTGLSLVLDAQLGPDGTFLGGQIHPLIQHEQDGPRPDAGATVVPLIRQLSNEDFGPSAARIGSDGIISQ
jgi:poly-gamma-glutamate capsule biosynthesis protein CapA/YwtB (metallophosphatase superfamily)